MDPSILKELQQLVAANIISEETANRIQEYYRAKPALAPSNKFTVILSILGALLVGLGIVLVVAHNWDDFDRTVKTIFAFLPLLLGQGLCAYTLLKRKDNFTWRECSAVILFFGIGTSISLTSQIYHLGGSLSDLLLVWMLLAAPLIYLLPSYIMSLLYIAGVTWYANIVGYGYESGDAIPWLYFPLLLVVLPMYIKLLRTKDQSNLFHVHNWFLAASFAVTLGAFGDRMDLSWSFMGYLSLFCMYYVVGTGKFFDKYKLFANPFLLSAVPAIVIILLIWSYDFLWKDGLNFLGRYKNEWTGPFLYFTAFFLLVIGFIFTRRYTRKDLTAISPVELSAFIFMIAMMFNKQFYAVSVSLINIWVLVLGIYFTRKGSIRNHLGILNLGLLIIASLAVLRFFDDSIPFVWRGIFFLVTGIGFFVANYLAIKKRKSLAIIKDPNQS